MPDNLTTELLCKLLEERGLSYQTHYLHVSWRVGPKLFDAVDNLDGTLTVDNLMPEQAIAATLGSEPPYDELLRCLENDWNIRASWDGLRKFWCIELTEEGVKLRDAELRGDAKRIHVNVDVRNHCPPCEYFEPEIIDYSVSWAGSECDRSYYTIDCKHRKVCFARHEWKAVKR